MRMRLETEPSQLVDLFQSTKRLKRFKKVKLPRTAREDQRKIPFAKLTTTKVVLELVNNALLLQHAHQSNLAVSKAVKCLVLVLLEQIEIFKIEHSFT
jgi:hypothetical protein